MPMLTWKKSNKTKFRFVYSDSCILTRNVFHTIAVRKVRSRFASLLLFITLHN